MKKLLLLIGFLFIVAIGYAQTIKAEVKDLSFMSGIWTLKHKWGDMEEFWGPPMGDNMVSSYRCVKDGKVVFYEFVVIEQTNGLPVMKMRHFNPGNIGWEEKDKPLMYKLIALTKSKVVFESPDKNLKLSYERLNPSKMNVVLDERDKKGVWQKEVFSYTLKP
ncbi:DUF6265 domain-containing protein [Mucilaginibacter galii]|uniref:DUF6265 domain-containing protein n=1 Tax=Mucilaginibacter galii TaxID=2005073 RepID=A0A917JA59_9SPHI|nr:DUF6265 family protein [Mucilaginibacter galii]GGI51376.1 hypothetical protein GCM10011425_25880 [Mucilaginibacter galii]